MRGKNMKVSLRGREVTKQQVIDAIKKFGRQYPDTNDYVSWLDKKTYRYAIFYKDRFYPCKFILSLASSLFLSEFSGGKGEANRVLEKLGFEIIEKPERNEVSKRITTHNSR